ncbi:MBL fold metallo-hydrolase [Chengkuizengella axinellae]|uniref:MBL fold metallo-hydrolase n=1 Tax=Chengkuizengella axinellae TaxID=3064388 RepID=A0ABT9J3K4_9BACL|nr:MBL fold metallo-hydrolase [Chengkuizengella sp. 2205SS18-9]MDP5276196.1 MBL fold metallo-hydrolase [Chengkuizengella sp. 2205SS18-9]
MRFYIEMINVGFGDSYVINFNNEGRMVRILVDGGPERNPINIDNIMDMIQPTHSEENEDHGCERKSINGIVVTHIDDDHIGGVLKLLNHSDVEKYIDLSQDCFIIFNDLVDPATISYKQGIRLKKIIDKFPNLSLVRTYEQNKRFEINGFEVCVRGINKLEPINKQEDLIIIDILLPLKETIKRLMKKWNVQKKDSKLINESSLSFVVNYKGRSILLSSDNFYSRILEQLQNIKFNSTFDLIMLAHHGSISNNEKILNLMDEYHCKQIMLPLSKSTSHHPSTVVLDKILERPENQLFCPVGLHLLSNYKDSNQIKFVNLIEI